MNSWNLVLACDPEEGAPTQLDKSDYRTAYLPAKVVDVKWAVDDLEVTLTWNQDKEGMEVFAESGFEVQRKNGMTWDVVSEVGPNEESVTFDEQSGGPKFYRIVSRTKALKIKKSVGDFGYMDEDAASEPVKVTLKFPAPTNPRVATPGTNSLNFEWNEVVGADGYDVRLRETTESDCKKDPEQKAKESGLSSTFRSLKASTTYLLCVRATLTDHPDATSDWAPLSKTTAPQRVVPPPQPRPPRPADTFDDREVVRSSWTAWELEGDGTVICYFQQYRYTRFVIESWITTHTWNGSRWVPSTSLFLTSSVMTRKVPLPGVRPTPCFLSSEAGGVSGASTAARQFLLSGDYVFSWGDKSVSFTVPQDARIDLAWRVLPSGLRAAVLTDDGPGEVLVHPGAVAPTADGADQRSTALRSIERSISQSGSVAAQHSGARGVACAVVSADVAVPQINLDVDRCATVATGGQVRMTADGRELTLMLTADRYWIVARVRTGSAGEYGPIALFDVATTSSLLLDPATGAEVARNIAEGADALGALFDAMIPASSAAAP